MSRLTIRKLVTEDLSYCCLWFFLTRFRKSRVVADRLGVDIRTINYARERVRCGEEKCAGSPKCMDKVITLERAPRRHRKDGN